MIQKEARLVEELPIPFVEKVWQYLYSLAADRRHVEKIPFRRLLFDDGTVSTVLCSKLTSMDSNKDGFVNKFAIYTRMT